MNIGHVDSVRRMSPHRVSANGLVDFHDFPQANRSTVFGFPLPFPSNRYYYLSPFSR